ncbi:MAG: hypothetical protein QM695_13615 [Micropruina sp.]
MELDDVVNAHQVSLDEGCGGFANHRHIVGDQRGLGADAANRLGLAELGESNLLGGRGDSFDLRTGDGFGSQQEAGDSGQPLGSGAVERTDTPFGERDLP